MQMDIFLWVCIVSCPWEYRTELHEYTVQSGQMNVVQLLYLLQIRELEMKKRGKFLFFSAFLHGLCWELQGHPAGVNAGSQQHGHTIKKLKAHSKCPPWSPVVQGESRGVDFTLPWAMETAVYTARAVFVTGSKPRAYLHPLLQIRARGPSQNLFLGPLSAGHVFSSSLGAGVSPPPVKHRKTAALAGPVSRGSKHWASLVCCLQPSHQWVIAVWGCIGFVWV